MAPQDSFIEEEEDVWYVSLLFDPCHAGDALLLPDFHLNRS